MTSENKNMSFLFICAVLFLMLLCFPVIVWLTNSFTDSISNSIIFFDKINYLKSFYLISGIYSFLLGIALIFVFLFIKNLIYEKDKKHKNLLGEIENIKIFSEKIGRGDLTANLTAENGNVGINHTLLLMRDSLRKTSQEEKERQWVMEGMTGLSELLRMNIPLHDLTYQTLVFLIRKTNAVQGAFYLTEEDITSKEIKIVLSACYAYNRKKYIRKEFRLCEGLVGQAAMERDYIYRTEIPDDYTTITSGILGDKKPVSLLIVPLIANERVQGAVELASLDKLKPLEINFIREISKIIAQTIFNNSVNVRTARLLEEVSNSQKRLQALLENASEVISIYDENRKVKYESPSVLKILGYTPEEMIGDPDFSRVHPKGQASIQKMFDDLLTFPNEQKTIELSYIKKNGERIWLETTGRNLLKDPAIQGIILNSRDITMRRKAIKEEKMRGQMQALSENSLDLIMRLNRKFVFYYINPVIEIFTGEKPVHFIQKNIREVNMDSTFVSLLLKMSEDVFTVKQKINREVEYVANGIRKILDVNAIPELDEENEMETVLIVAHDITEAKMNEQKIRESNKKITESINYAHRIQKVMLPEEKNLTLLFPESFMLYEPRDLVSGDFPWLFERGDDIYFAAVDCTGHGVPGAFMSLIANFLLNQNTGTDGFISPGTILDFAHQGIVKTLKQEENPETHDGMDIALCKINLNKLSLEYAGSHRPLYLVRDNELIEIKGDRYPVGGNQYRNRKPFTNHSLVLQKGDSIYLFTDGLPDQIGGPEGKKFTTSKIKEIILKNNVAGLREIGAMICNEYREWKNGFKQIDDVLIMGIRII